jgi:5-methylcytosine-specific restriction enzyme subunit McrC
VLNLFEYQNKEVLSEEFNGLELFLDEIWNKREKYAYFTGEEDEKSESQRFLQFIQKSGEIKSNKYVGVIRYNGIKINLLPKIFYDDNKEYTSTQITQIHNHILWWLSYCRKIKFPSYQTSLGSAKNDFFEVLIYLFSKYTRSLLASSIYQQYEGIERELSFIKGRINTTEYINRNLCTGKWHKINCSFDAFELDNEFNRIIKFVTTLLFNASENLDNKKNLREILFMLDEVSDVRATAEQCAAIKFNPMFGEYETVRDYCHLFLSNSISFDYKNNLRLFAFLLPMEYVFEDFIFGFIDKELEKVKAKAQSTEKFLDESKIYTLRPDLLLQTEQGSIIADTKYKIVYSDEKDPKKGISQSDIYQMLAYAIRFNMDQIILFYPNTITCQQDNSTEIIIKDAFATEKNIYLKAFQLPVINREILQISINVNMTLDELFMSLRELLKTCITRILMKAL